jgi:hypothetical protein
MKERVVIFDKTTGEPIAMIQTADPTLILLNSDEEKHSICPAPEGDWKNIAIDPKSGSIKKLDNTELSELALTKIKRNLRGLF